MDKETMKIIQENTAKQQKERLENFRRLNMTAQKGQILFTGSSLMEQFPIEEISMTNHWQKNIF